MTSYDNSGSPRPTTHSFAETGAPAPRAGELSPEPSAVLTGVIPPVCTPLTPDFEVDTASLTRLVDHLLDGGVDGLFILGSTSEVAYLPDAHRRTVLDTVIGHVGGQVPVLAGAIDMTSLRVLDHARTAAKAGANAIVATAPFYTRTHPVEIDQHFRTVAAGVDLPLYAYDLPVSVHSKLGAELVLALAADGVLAGLKDSSGDEGGLRAVILGRRERGLPAFSVLTGGELTVDSALLMGADGVVPGLGNVDPHGYTRLFRAARSGDWAAARTDQERLLRLFEFVGVGAGRMGMSSSALGAFKAGLYLRGIIAHPTTMVPQVPLNSDEIARVGKYLEAAGLL